MYKVRVESEIDDRRFYNKIFKLNIVGERDFSVGYWYHINAILCFFFSFLDICIAFSN